MLKKIIVMLLSISCLYAGEVRLVFSGALNGKIDGCFCETSPKGGMVKLASFVRSYKEKHENTILLCTGDILSSTVLKPDAKLDDDTKKKYEYIFEGYNYMNYDALVLGDQEASKGVDFFLKESHKLPYLNANISFKDGNKTKSFGEAYRVREVDGVRVGIIGITSSSAFKYYISPDTKHIKEAVDILDEEVALKKNITELKNRGVKFIIVLSHSGYDRDRELIKKFEDINVIIGGHDNQMPLKFTNENDYFKMDYIDPAVLIKERYDFDGRYVFESGQHGLYAGVLIFEVDDKSVTLKEADYKRMHYGVKVPLKDFKRSENKAKVLGEKKGFVYLDGDPSDETVEKWLKELGMKHEYED